MILIVPLEVEKRTQSSVNVNTVLLTVSFKVTAWAHSYWSNFTSESQSTYNTCDFLNVCCVNLPWATWLLCLVTLECRRFSVIAVNLPGTSILSVGSGNLFTS